MFALLGSLDANSVECATSKCYLDVYGSAERTPLVSRARKIHKRLVGSIGSQELKRSKLVVIDTDGYPWALALRDNSVVVTRGAVEKMYNESDLELGDARLAFVLGHELSHLRTADLFHHQAFVDNAMNDISKPAWLRSQPEDELRADLRGFTYATISGYKTDLLIGGDDNFFDEWLPQITTQAESTTHPDNNSRREYVKHGFQRILNDVPYYWFGLGLAHFGQYDDAKHLLEDNLNTAETAEAYGNLGYVNVQLARSYMHPNVAYKYWIPTLLEPDSGLSLTKSRTLFNTELSEQALFHLREAEELLLHSISLDHDNLATHTNLAAVYLYMPGKLHRAYASIEDARQTTIGRLPSVRDQLISIYELVKVRDHEDRWHETSDTLIGMARRRVVPDNLLFNLGRMLDERGKHDSAREYWQALHDRRESLPIAYQKQVCSRLSIECIEKKLTSPWIGEVPLGKNITFPDVRKQLGKQWNIKSPAKKLVGVQAQVISNSYGDSVLVLDGTLEMMILRNIPARYRTVEDLLTEYGEPHAYLPTLNGQVLSYGTWAALVRDRTITELWVNKLVP